MDASASADASLSTYGGGYAAAAFAPGASYADTSADASYSGAPAGSSTTLPLGSLSSSLKAQGVQLMRMLSAAKQVPEVVSHST